MTDPQLLHAFTHDAQPDAFAQIVHRHASLVYSAARRQLKDPALAEDVTQAVLSSSRKKLKISLSPPTTILSGWLINTTRFACKRALTMQSRRRRHEQKAAAMNTETFSDPLPTNDIHQHLDAALAKLPAPDRDAIVLRFLQQKSLHDLSTTLAISEPAAQKRVARALQKLRRLFAKNGITLSLATLATLLAATPLLALPPTLNLNPSLLATLAVAPQSATTSTLIAKGVTHMATTATKTKLTLLSLALLSLITFPTAYYLHSHSPQTPAPSSILTTTAPTTDSPPANSPELLALLTQCEKAMSQMNISEYSFEDHFHFTNPENKTAPEMTYLRSGKILRDGYTRWFADCTDTEPTTSPPPNQTYTDHWITSYAKDLLLYRSDQRPGSPIPGEIAIWPNDHGHLRGTEGYAQALDGIIPTDQIAGFTFEEPTFFFETMRNSNIASTTPPNLSNPASPVTLTATATGKYGRYDVTLDPRSNNLPTRIEVTKTADDLAPEEPLHNITGKHSFPILPDDPIQKYHALLDHIHISSIGPYFAIDSARLTQEYTFSNRPVYTITNELRRTQIHINPPFTNSDFTLSAPDNTPVVVLDHTGGPDLIWLNGQILHKSDHKPATEKDKFPNHLQHN